MIHMCQGHSHPKLLIALGIGSKSSADKIQPTAHKPTLGAEGVLPSRQIESFLRVFKQFTHNLPSRCHDLVSFSLQILQVINESNDLTIISLILSYQPHSLSFHYLIKGKDDIIFKTYTRQYQDIYSSGLEPWNSSQLISHTSSSVSVSSSSLPSLLPVNSETGTKV